MLVQLLIDFSMNLESEDLAVQFFFLPRPHKVVAELSEILKNWLIKFSQSTFLNFVINLQTKEANASCENSGSQTILQYKAGRSRC